MLKQFGKRNSSHGRTQQFIGERQQDWKTWVNLHPQSGFLKHQPPTELTNPKSHIPWCKGEVCLRHHVIGCTETVNLLMTGHPDPDALISDETAQPWLSHPLSIRFLKLTHQLSLSSPREKSIMGVEGT